jgi:hypothetical protein
MAYRLQSQIGMPPETAFVSSLKDDQCLKVEAPDDAGAVAERYLLLAAALFSQVEMNVSMCVDACP